MVICGSRNLISYDKINNKTKKKVKKQNEKNRKDMKTKHHEMKIINQAR